MLKNLRKNDQGFTIIEVLIVLAIAGLIMLIVFLAIPALQRNQRNNARNADASRIAAAIGECLGNRNGVTGSCGASVVDGLAGTRSQLIDAVTEGGTGSISGASIDYGAKCSTDGSTPDGANPTPRDYVVLYEIETSGGGTLPRCAGSQ